MRRAWPVVPLVCCVLVGHALADAHPLAGPPAPADTQYRSRLEILLARGYGALARGQDFEAEGAFRDAIQANPRDLRGYLALARAYGAARQLGRAREVLSAAERVALADPRIVITAAEILESAGELLEARTMLREHTRVHPRDYQVLRVFAGLLERGGQLTEALACYRRLALGDDLSLRAEAALHARALARILGPAERVRPRPRDERTAD